MSFKIELVNGVTKSGELGGTIVYTFPYATIIIDVANDSMVLTYPDKASNYQKPQTIAFADLDDNLSTEDIEEYVDQLATSSYFFPIAAV